MKQFARFLLVVPFLFLLAINSVCFASEDLEEHYAQEAAYRSEGMRKIDQYARKKHPEKYDELKTRYDRVYQKLSDRGAEWEVEAADEDRAINYGCFGFMLFREPYHLNDPSDQRDWTIRNEDAPQAKMSKKTLEHIIVLHNVYVDLQALSKNSTEYASKVLQFVDAYHKALIALDA